MHNPGRVQEPESLQEYVCLCEGTALQGPGGRRQEYGMVQEPTIESI